MVVTATRGIFKPLARSASDTNVPMDDGARHQGSSISSAKVIRRRWAHRLFKPTTSRKWSRNENRCLQVFANGGPDQRNDRELDPPLGQVAAQEHRTVRLHHPKIDAWVLLPQPLHHGGAQAREQRFRAADPQLPRRGVGHELDLVHACSEIIENRDAAPEQGAAVRRRLDALGAAIEQADAEHVFEIGYHFRHDRLRDREMLGGSRHAAPFRHRHHDLQVLQLEPVADEFRLHHVAPIL